MKILYITDSLAIWGGIERVLIEKMNLLADEYDYHISVLTTDQGNHKLPFPLSPKVLYQDLMISFHHEYKSKGIRRILVRYNLKQRFKLRLKEKIEEIKPSIIVCVRPFLLDSLFQVKGHIPLIFESHSACKSYLYGNGNVFRKFLDFLDALKVRKALGVVTLTEGDAEDWRRISNNVSVIPNIVHLNNAENYSDCSANIALYVGRFSAQKDVRALIDVWKIVHRRHPQWELHIYGGYGDQYEELIEMLNNLDINVYVYEPTLQIFEKYKNSSMLLLTSLYEPFGLVLPEAMSCGLPVVAFDCPYGPADIITDNVNGFLIPNRDVSMFADKVCMLMEDISLRKKMGKEGIVSSQRYSKDRIMPEWIKFFEQIVNE